MATNYQSAEDPEAPPDHEAAEEEINPQVASIILAAASICELIAASLVCSESDCTGLEAYSVAVGVASLVLLAPIVLVLFAEPLAPRRLPEGLPHLALLLLAWWLPACFLLTFISPFQGLCNGYFATLAATAGAVHLARAYVPAFDALLRQLQTMAHESAHERTVLIVLSLLSTAVWVEAAIALGRFPGEHPAVKAWAIVVGVVSMVLCAFYLLLDNLQIHKLGFAALLAVWWCQGVAISFVPSTYMFTCNGFISTWASSFVAFYFLHSTRSPRDLLPIPAAEPGDEGLGAGFGGPTTTYQAADATDGFSQRIGIDSVGRGGNPWVDPSKPIPKLGPAPPETFRHTSESASE
jgi:hypothetical protein